ncbi:hypothetical protein [Virgibacillus senegalensis]|uniref:hypothetical protein n=1 Tax=Virgibacillus senegalensis TaxID=1499679 RepID=UPI00069F791F|nr:hypothetical protein [Virgibacillus senegalensis]
MKKLFILLSVACLLAGCTKYSGGEPVNKDEGTEEKDSVSSSKKQTEEPSEEAQTESKKKDTEESENEFLIDLYAISKMSQEDIRDKFGDPESTEESTLDGQAAHTETYSNGLEVMYIDGTSARITLTPEEPIKVPDDRKKLSVLVGFDEVAPDFENEMVTRWEGIANLSELSAFAADSGNIDYFYLITDEKYK